VSDDHVDDVLRADPPWSDDEGRPGRRRLARFVRAVVS